MSHPDGATLFTSVWNWLPNPQLQGVSIATNISGLERDHGLGKSCALYVDVRAFADSTEGRRKFLIALLKLHHGTSTRFS